MRAELKGNEKRLAKREDNLEAKLDTLATKERNLELAHKKLVTKGEAAAKREQEADTLLGERRERLLEVSRMTFEEAKRIVLKEVLDELDHEAAEMVAKSVAAAKDEAMQRAREIILTAIQRYAGEHTCETTVSTVAIPSDEMKGRVIGREGRNIRAFERATGVDEQIGVHVLSHLDQRQALFLQVYGIDSRAAFVPVIDFESRLDGVAIRGSGGR